MYKSYSITDYVINLQIKNHGNPNEMSLFKKKEKSPNPSMSPLDNAGPVELLGGITGILDVKVPKK